MTGHFHIKFKVPQGSVIRPFLSVEYKNYINPPGMSLASYREFLQKANRELHSGPKSRILIPPLR